MIMIMVQKYFEKGKSDISKETKKRKKYICLVGEKPDKELPGIVGARGDTV